MIYLPWIIFGLAILWMIRQGSKAKEDYLRRKAEEESKKPDTRPTVHARTVPENNQGQAAELVGALAGERQTRVTGFAPQGGK